MQNRLDNYLDKLNKQFLQLSFNVVRIYFFSNDREALICRKFYKNGINIDPKIIRRIVIKKSIYSKEVIDSNKIIPFSYKDTNLLNDPYREDLGKQNIEHWIEAPISSPVDKKAFGLICLINSKRNRNYEESTIRKIAKIISDARDIIFGLSEAERFDRQQKIIANLSKIDDNFLYEIGALTIKDLRKIDPIFENTIAILKKQTEAETVDFRQKKGSLLNTRVALSNKKLPNFVIDLSNEDHRSLVTCEAVLNKEYQYRTGKPPVELYRKIFISKDIGDALFICIFDNLF